MRTLAEFSSLAAASVALWRARLVPLLTLFALGWSMKTVGTQAATAMGGAYPWLSIIVFSLGVLGYVGALGLMLHLFEPLLPTLSRLRRAEVLGGPRVPDTLAEPHSRGTVLAMALGPFLAVYAVWGLVDDELRNLFLSNVIAHGSYNVDEWSVNLSNWRLYAVIAAVAWGIKFLGERLARRTGLAALRLTAATADGIFVFTSTLALVRIVADATDWLGERQVWAWLLDAWRTMLLGLPDWHLPFGWQLPAFVVASAAWFVGTLLPDVWQHLVLPLMWLSLAAVVFGWHEITEVVPGRGGRLDPLRRMVTFATTDLREKYLPLARILGVAVRSGPRFLGAYLLATSLLWVGEASLDALMTTIVGPVPVDQAVLLSPAQQLLQGLLVMPLQLALYAAAFDRCLRGVATEAAFVPDPAWATPAAPSRA